MSDDLESKSIEAIVKEAEKRAQRAPSPKLASGLTNEEELFCQAMVKHNDQWRAVQEAGYQIKDKRSANTKAWKLMHRDRVIKRIEELRNATALRNNVTADHVVQMLLDIYKRAMEASKFDAANRACEMLGNYLDIFKNSTKPSSVTNVLNVSDGALMDRELKRLASAAGVKLLTSEVVNAEYEEVAKEAVGQSGPSEVDRRLRPDGAVDTAEDAGKGNAGSVPDNGVVG